MDDVEFEGLNETENASKRTFSLGVVDCDAPRKRVLASERKGCVLARRDGHLRIDALYEVPDRVGSGSLGQVAVKIHGAAGEVRCTLNGVAFRGRGLDHLRTEKQDEWVHCA